VVSLRRRSYRLRDTEDTGKPTYDKGENDDEHLDRGSSDGVETVIAKGSARGEGTRQKKKNEKAKAEEPLVPTWCEPASKVTVATKMEGGKKTLEESALTHTVNFKGIAYELDSKH